MILLSSIYRDSNKSRNQDPGYTPNQDIMLSRWRCGSITDHPGVWVLRHPQSWWLWPPGSSAKSPHRRGDNGKVVVSGVSEWPSGPISEGILSEVPISWVFFPSASHRKIPSWEAKKQQLRDMTAPDSADAVREDSPMIWSDFCWSLYKCVWDFMPNTSGTWPLIRIPTKGGMSPI